MTTATPAATGSGARRSTFREAQHRLAFSGVLRSEWIKLTSVRSIGWAITTAIVITAGLGALVTLATLATAPEGAIEQGMLGDMPVASLGASGLLVSQLVFAVLGVIAITGEYGSGQIRSSLTAVPRRLPVLGGKALVLGCIAFVASGLALALGIAATIGVALSFGVELDAMSIGLDVPFAILGGATYLALLTVFSLGVGALVRSGAGAIAIALGVLIVLPTVVSLIPFEVVQEASPYLLPNAGLTLSMPGAEPGADFWRALAVTVAWPAVTLIGAASAMLRRDA